VSAAMSDPLHARGEVTLELDDGEGLTVVRALVA